MSDALRFSVFHDVFFPADDEGASQEASDLKLQKVIRFQPELDTSIADLGLVVFDFETTGLDSNADQIIEVGALKIENGEVVKEFSTLVDPGVEISEQVQNITGIDSAMLRGQPKIGDILGEFLDFFSASVLVAHNAEFDMAFLRAACRRQGVQLQWPALCTLKMARQLIPELGSKNLDTLAEHYELSFEARHRSIGDCKVTAAVMQEMLSEHAADFKNFGSLKEFYVTKS